MYVFMPSRPAGSLRPARHDSAGPPARTDKRSAAARYHRQGPAPGLAPTRLSRRAPGPLPRPPCDRELAPRPVRAPPGPPHVRSAGQGAAGQRPPEPCAQVRILLWAPSRDLLKLLLTCVYSGLAVAIVPPLSVTRRPFAPESAPHTRLGAADRPSPGA